MVWQYFEGLLSFWHNFESTWANLDAFGRMFIVVNSHIMNKDIYHLVTLTIKGLIGAKNNRHWDVKELMTKDNRYNEDTKERKLILMNAEKSFSREGSRRLWAQIAFLASCQNKSKPIIIVETNKSYQFKNKTKILIFSKLNFPLPIFLPRLRNEVLLLFSWQCFGLFRTFLSSYKR